MIDFLQLSCKQRVLLVGEGNFSFTISLLRKLHFAGASVPANLVSTCYQKYKDLATDIKSNARLANQLGAEVWFGVDATCLHDHERFKDSWFDCIIFNFPHVGGKMKIQQNRLLLKKFFTSASLLLGQEGKILVSLCKGQSGTPYDPVSRTQGDTWQVVTMATYGDLVLKLAMPFIPEDYPEYICNGYRGLDKKGFLVQGAYSFVFSRAPLVLPDGVLQANYIMEQETQTMLHCCPYMQARIKKLVDQGTFAETKFFEDFFTESTQRDLCALNRCSEVKNICFCRATSGWKDVLLPEIATTFRDVDVGNLLVCSSCDQSADSVQRVIVMCLPTMQNVESLLRILAEACDNEGKYIQSFGGKRSHYYSGKDEWLVASVLDAGDDKSRYVVALYVDALLELGMNSVAPPRLLSSSKLDLLIRSRHPPAYWHHLSFWIPETQIHFSHQRFTCALRYIGRKLVKTFSLIEEYECPISGRQSVCYRILYQSRVEALTPERSHYFHRYVVGSFLELCLNVTVR